MARTEESIFAEALDQSSPDKRAAFVNAACGDDAGMRARVERLLKSHTGAGSFLSKPVAATVDPLVLARPGTLVGPYKLREQIGEGGFGVVYVAEQEKPVRRRVALKIIKPGMDTKDVIARFEAERQALALMDHPNVARVLDAGATDSGRPYFVMELVHGVPITEFCDKNKLPTRDRLVLFADVGRAVQHAHQKGIIHRDLKPSNIMVTLHDGKPVAKVIDFGVSKALSQQLTEKSIYTAYGQMIGTPSYMSPEQAEMSGLGIDTRSDIYSLGVLLYELLTGKTPLDAARLRAGAYAEVLRMIKEEEPPRPSLKVSTLGEEATVIAQHRDTDPKNLRRDLVGELDWIVMRCLEKDRARRYETANGLVRDIERYLKDEPVEACRPSAIYRLRKFTRRNRVAVFLTTFIAATVAAVLVNHFVGLLQIRQQRDRAVAAERRAEQALASEQAARQEAEAAKQSAEQSAQRLSQATQLSSDGIEYYTRSNWHAAHDHFTRAMQIEPGLNTPYIYRGALFTRLGLWEHAAADYQRRFQLAQSANAETWFDYLLLRIYTGDDAGYRQACQEMLRQHQTSAEARSRYCVVRACLLTPDPVVDRDELVRRAEALAASARAPWYVGLAAKSHLCSRNYGLAEARCREAIKLGAGAPNGVQRVNHVVLALALHHQGQSAEAKQALAVADQAKDQWTTAMQTGLVGAMPLNWCDWLEFLHEHRQATTAILGAPPAADPRLAAIHERALASVTYGDVFTFMDNGRAQVRRRDWDQAATSFVQVLDKLPPGFRNSSQRERFCVEMVQTPEVFDRLIKLRPANQHLWNARGRTLANAGEWAQAAVDLQKSLDLLTPTLSPHDPPNQPSGWFAWGATQFELGALLLLAGDESGYQALCESIQATPDLVEGPFVLSCAARACTMSPLAATDYAKPVVWAQFAVDRHPRVAWYLFALGIAQHRAGQHEDAIKSLQRSLAVNETWVGRGQNFATLALACNSLGREAEAGQWLNQTRSWLKETNRNAAGWKFGYATSDYLSDWLCAQVLLREAERLLADAPSS